MECKFFVPIIRKIRLAQHIGNYFGLPKLYRANNFLRTKTTALNLAYRIHGPSPTPESTPIIVLHGCLGTKKNWENMCRQLTAGSEKPVIAVDARNHGDSPYCDAHDYFSLAADVSQLISKFKIDNSIIIGHSMGGRAAMVLALTEPSLVASLIVVDISPVSTSACITDTLPRIMDVMMSVNFKGLDLKEAKAAARRKILGNNLFQSTAELQALLMNIGQLPDKSFGWLYNLKTLKKRFKNIAEFPNMSKMEPFTDPTLFLAGKQSYCIPCEDLPGIHSLFPSASLLYVDGAGHNIHIEDPTSFENIVVQFINNNTMIQTHT